MKEFVLGFLSLISPNPSVDKNKPIEIELPTIIPFEQLREKKITKLQNNTIPLNQLKDYEKDNLSNRTIQWELAKLILYIEKNKCPHTNTQQFLQQLMEHNSGNWYTLDSTMRSIASNIVLPKKRKLTKKIIDLEVQAAHDNILKRDALEKLERIYQSERKRDATLSKLIGNDKD